MKVIYAGVGSAFAPAGAWNTQAVIVAESGKKLLIDCSRDAQHSLNAVGINARDIDAVYISHLHGDHVYGLEWLAFSTYSFDGSPTKKPMLYGVGSVLSKLWAQVMRGTLEPTSGKINTFSDYFDVNLIEEGATFSWESLEFKPVRTYHVHNGQRWVDSFGLMVTQESGYKVFFTTDTTLALPQLEAAYNEADVIFHDCETTEGKSGVHAHYTELVELPKHVKSKMHLIHYQHNACYHTRDPGWHGFRPQAFVRAKTEFEFGGL